MLLRKKTTTAGQRASVREVQRTSANRVSSHCNIAINIHTHPQNKVTNTETHTPFHIQQCVTNTRKRCAKDKRAPDLVTLQLRDLTFIHPQTWWWTQRKKTWRSAREAFLCTHHKYIRHTTYNTTPAQKNNKTTMKSLKFTSGSWNKHTGRNKNNKMERIHFIYNGLVSRSRKTKLWVVQISLLLFFFPVVIFCFWRNKNKQHGKDSFIYKGDPLYPSTTLSFAENQTWGSVNFFVEMLAFCASNKEK